MEKELKENIANLMDKRKALEVLKMIREDAESDAKEFDGKPFTGKTVGTYLGNHGASIATLADIISELIKQDEYQQTNKNIYLR